MRTVLIVEDEWAIADWLSMLLTEQHFRVLVAGNGRRAMEILRQENPDLVLTDFMMPVMDGSSLLKAMHNDGLAHVPVLMMSSLPEHAVQENCDGYRAFLRKPFREGELLAMIERVLAPKH